MNTTMDAITIDPEFRNHCPPLTEAERKLLLESLNQAGLLSPLIVWRHEGKTILVDGHNRHEILQELDRLDEIKTTELVFGARENALNWIIKNQLGRRNLAPDAAALLRGKLYIAQRIPVKERLFQAGVSANPGGVAKAQDCHSGSPEEFGSTADEIAEKTGVSARTIARDAKFAEAVNQLGITKEVMAGKEKRSRKEIIQAASPPRKAPPAKPERPLADILAKRWEAFIKDIPVTKHSELRLWLTQKLQSHAL
jgi:ParB-like chromosome segregation protein Spo0J